MLNISLATFGRKLFGFRKVKLSPRQKLRRGLLRRAQLHLRPMAAEVLKDRALLAAPIAYNDAYSVLHDRVNNPSLSVLNNDDGGGMPPYMLTASLYSGASRGSVSLSSAGMITYTPTAGYTGADSFTYRVYNGEYSNVGAIPFCGRWGPGFWATTANLGGHDRDHRVSCEVGSVPRNPRFARMRSRWEIFAWMDLVDRALNRRNKWRDGFMRN
jgi:Bacterial Ig domain